MSSESKDDSNAELDEDFYLEGLPMATDEQLNHLVSEIKAFEDARKSLSQDSDEEE